MSASASATSESDEGTTGAIVLVSPGVNGKVDTKTDGPVPELHVYAGGNVNWPDIEIPEGIEVVDNRLEALNRLGDRCIRILSTECLRCGREDGARI